MPNYCNYVMNVVGDEHNVEEFIQILQNDYNGDKNDPLHMCRVFEANLVDGRQFGCNKIYASISGHCAWSVYTCMFEGEHTYYEDCLGLNNNTTSIPRETKRLNLTLELWGTESGGAFSEHYIVSNGDILTDEEFKYYELPIDDINSLQEFQENYADFFEKELSVIEYNSLFFNNPENSGDIYKTTLLTTKGDSYGVEVGDDVIVIYKQKPYVFLSPNELLEMGGDK